MIEYKTIYDGNLNVFESEINNLLKINWNLYGNPYIGEELFFQALTRKVISDE